MKKKQGIYISCRWDTGGSIARMIYDRLRLEKRCKCFMNVEKLPAEIFYKRIRQDMSMCDIFIPVLSRDALFRCNIPNDKMRMEIAAAIEMGRAFMPVVSEDFIWSEEMPEEIKSIKDFNAILYVQTYSEAVFHRLYGFIKIQRKEDERKRLVPIKF